MDVIAAIATGSAATAIGIVRVSGDGCFALCGALLLSGALVLCRSPLVSPAA